MTQKTTDWKAIETDYTHGIIIPDEGKHYPTYKELSEKYELAEGTLRNKGAKKKWAEKRKSHKQKVTLKVIEKKANSPCIDDEAAAEYDAEVIVLSDQKFESTGEKLRQLVEKKIETYTEDLDSVKDYNIKNLGDALESAQRVVKTAQGELLEKTKIEVHNNTDLNIIDDDFMNKELEFMKKILKK